jgi:hypothetical protein
VNATRSPRASSRPATTGSLAPGSHAHANACRGSEVVVGVGLAGLAHELRQQRQPVLDAARLEPQPRAVLVEQRDPGQHGRLEGDAEAHARVAALDLGHRRRAPAVARSRPVGSRPRCRRPTAS